MKHVFLILAVVCLGGCATAIKARSDNEFTKKNRPVITADLGVVHSKLYVGKGGHRSFEIKTNNGTYYVNSHDYGSIEISDSMVESAKYIKDITIYLMTKSQFVQSDTMFSSGQYASEVYVIFRDNINDKVVDSKTISAIYYKTNGEIRERSHVENKLSLDVGNRVILALKTTGYLVTVPIDIVTSPLLVGILLSGSIDAR